MMDRALESTFYFWFTTRAFATGIPTTLAGTPSIEIYEDGSTTPITAGITLSTDVNSRAGLNRVTVVATTANGFESGKSYAASIAAGTVSSVSVVGEVVKEFSIDLLAAEITDQLLDEALSDHNVGGSAGKALRQIKEGVVSVESTVNDASATTTSFVTALTEASDSHYSDLTMVFIDGALAGQSRLIQTYDGTTKVVTFDEAWSEAPGNGDGFIILTTHSHTTSQIADVILTTALTESYNADGSPPTLAQALFVIMQMLTEKAVSGTTVTIKKLDGSTTAFTLTLDDGSDPTSVTRAT